MTLRYQDTLLISLLCILTSTRIWTIFLRQSNVSLFLMSTQMWVLCAFCPWVKRLFGGSSRFSCLWFVVLDANESVLQIYIYVASHPWLSITCKRYTRDWIAYRCKHFYVLIKHSVKQHSRTTERQGCVERWNMKNAGNGSLGAILGIGKQPLKKTRILISTIFWSMWCDHRQYW